MLLCDRQDSFIIQPSHDNATHYTVVMYYNLLCSCIHCFIFISLKAETSIAPQSEAKSDGKCLPQEYIQQLSMDIARKISGRGFTFLRGLHCKWLYFPIGFSLLWQ